MAVGGLFANVPFQLFGRVRKRGESLSAKRFDMAASTCGLREVPVVMNIGGRYD